MTKEQLLNKISEKKKELDSYRPFPKEFIKNLQDYYRVHFTYHSNAIEGNSLTLIETKIVIEDGITIGGKSLREHLEAINHASAVDEIIKLANSKTEINQKVLLNLHKLILDKIDSENAGKLRKQSVYITGSEYKPPPPSKIPNEMRKFWRWFKSKSALSLHPVELSAIAHTKLVHIHPFIDGNGRIARLLMNLMLVKNTYPIVVIPMIIRNEYISAVRIADYGNYEPIVTLIARQVYETLKDTLRMLKESKQ